MTNEILHYELNKIYNTLILLKDFSGEKKLYEIRNEISKAQKLIDSTMFKKRK